VFAVFASPTLPTNDFRSTNGNMDFLGCSSEVQTWVNSMALYTPPEHPSDAPLSIMASDGYYAAGYWKLNREKSPFPRRGKALLVDADAQTACYSCIEDVSDDADSLITRMHLRHSQPLVRVADSKRVFIAPCQFRSHRHLLCAVQVALMRAARVPAGIKDHVFFCTLILYAKNHSTRVHMGSSGFAKICAPTTPLSGIGLSRISASESPASCCTVA
jgi:hypothetical protein